LSFEVDALLETSIESDLQISLFRHKTIAFEILKYHMCKFAECVLYIGRTLWRSLLENDDKFHCVNYLNKHQKSRPFIAHISILGNLGDLDMETLTLNKIF